MKTKSNDLFFYSDPHFGHINIIRLCSRPFLDLQDMEDRMIANYNSVVPENGTTIWLGDTFFVGPTKAKEILSKLNGRKILIRGNHDRGVGSMYNCGFDFVCEGMILKICGVNVSLSHFPLEGSRLKFLLNKYFRHGFSLQKLFSKQFLNDIRYKRHKYRYGDEGQIHIHGHSHSSKEKRVSGRMIDVGVDAWGFKPVSFSEIESIVHKLKETI